MQNFLSGLFALGVLIAFAGGILGVIAPSIFRIGRMKESPGRKKIVAVAGGVFIASFVGFVASVPEPTPEERAAQAAAAAKAQAERDAADKAEAQAKAEKAKQAKENERLADRRAVEKLWNQIADADKECSEKAKTVAAVGASDRYEAYSAVTAAQSACRVAHYAIRELKVSDRFEGEAEEKFETAIRKCADSSLARQLAFEAMLPVLDGDERPSALQSVKDAGETAQLAGFQCVIGFISAANVVGVSIEEYVKGDGSR